VENQQARHIGEIIRERNNRGAYGIAPAPGPKLTCRVQKILRLVLSRVLDVLAAIGWFVMLPFITRGGHAPTPRE
jgi:hypothetical protein